MSRRNQQHQPVNLIAFHALELFGNLPMERRCLITMVRKLSEGDQARRRRPPFAFRQGRLLESEQ
jgi:hypothetical protein